MTKNKMTFGDFEYILRELRSTGIEVEKDYSVPSKEELGEVRDYRHTSNIPEGLVEDFELSLRAIGRHMILVENYNRFMKNIDSTDKTKAFNLYKVMYPEKYVGIDYAYDTFNSLTDSEKEEAMKMLKAAVESSGG